MTASMQGEVSPSIATGSESAAADQERLQLLILEKKSSEQGVEQVVTGLSDAFDGYLAFTTDCVWLDREREFRSGSAVAVELFLTESDGETTSESSN